MDDSQHKTILYYEELNKIIDERELLLVKVLQPKLSIDGNMWCALYGDNLQDGVAGFGKSPEAALYDFVKYCKTELKSEY